MSEKLPQPDKQLDLSDPLIAEVYSLKPTTMTPDMQAAFDKLRANDAEQISTESIDE